MGFKKYFVYLILDSFIQSTGLYYGGYGSYSVQLVDYVVIFSYY